MTAAFLPHRWKELAPLLDAVLDCEPHERAACLDRACDGDAALRAELETLLAECAESDGMFVTGAVERFAALLTDTPRRLPGIIDGRYRVERVIGTGGMASVYLVRDLKHDREVALKILRSDLSAAIGADRFLAEVRLTAKLEHPHILSLIDSGSVDGSLFYVMPYVRGESLRAKLAREKQLELEEALSITRQIASALDYTHPQGIVHRDIKPENILLHEGEAMLADFGIALAAAEAGGGRLTNTSLSLGTPQYMSPEQATGDAMLDTRSDIYSLAAVLYEMIAGEPPVTGATKQEIIAKLLTERPVSLRSIREAIPEDVDRAIAKALSKAPADRFATADAFARALGAVAGPRPLGIRARRRWHGPVFAASAVVSLLVAEAWISRAKLGGRSSGITLADRRQITFTGGVTIPAISGDGRTLAYRTTACGRGGCTFGIEVQDVGSAVSRRLFDGASAIYGIEWSPDRRNLLFRGTINPLRGSFIVSALGGRPRPVPGHATFYAGGDSLLFVDSPHYNSPGDKWLLVSGLDGVIRDSIHVGDPGDLVDFFGAVPGSKWIFVGVYERRLLDKQIVSVESRLIDRHGRIAGRAVFGHVGTSAEAHASSDAVWVSPGGEGWPKRAVLRVLLDPVSGHLASHVDTLQTGVHTSFGVTADGSALVLDEGSTEFTLWGLDVSEALRGEFPEQKRLLRSTSALNVRLSPDGKRVVVGHDVGTTADGLQRWFTIPFEGGAEVALASTGETSEAEWFDSGTVAVRDRVPAGARLALVGVATGTVRAPLEVPDRYPHTYARLPAGGWVWVRMFSPELSLQLPGEASPRRVRLPAWYSRVNSVGASHDSRFAVFSGWNAPNEDSIGVSLMSLADSAVTPWFTTFGESGEVTPSKHGTFLLRLRDTPETYSLYHLLGPGRADRLGAIPGAVSSLSVSEDLTRAAIVVPDHHGDAWMSGVVRP